MDEARSTAPHYRTWMLLPHRKTLFPLLFPHIYCFKSTIIPSFSAYDGRPERIWVKPGHGCPEGVSSEALKESITSRFAAAVMVMPAVAAEDQF